MLKNISDEVSVCYQNAEHCARKAAEQTDPELRAIFLEVERHWLFLARSYQTNA
jgi:hypothetical protein